MAGSTLGAHTALSQHMFKPTSTAVAVVTKISGTLRASQLFTFTKQVREQWGPGRANRLALCWGCVTRSLPLVRATASCHPDRQVTTGRFHFTALWFPNQHQHPFIFSQKRTNTSDGWKGQLALTECCPHSPVQGGSSQPQSPSQLQPRPELTHHRLSSSGLPCRVALCRTP